MTSLEAFFYGSSASLALEIIAIYNMYCSGNKILPDRYRMISFWIVRTLVCVIAGGLAMAYKVDNPLLAANIGASAPLILQALAQGIRAPNQTTNE